MCNCTSENPYSRSWLWIPGLRQEAHPGMTIEVVGTAKWRLCHARRCASLRLDASVGPAVQEDRDVESFFLDRIAHRRGAAVRIKALRSRMTRIFRNRRRSPLGVAGRRTERRTLQLRQRCTTLDPLGDATPVVVQPAGEFRE